MPNLLCLYVSDKDFFLTLTTGVSFATKKSQSLTKQAFPEQWEGAPLKKALMSQILE
jgi:hypothetical protein